MAAGLAAEVQVMPAGIPVIDIAGLYSDNLMAKKAVAAKLGAACDDIGFFYAVNHNVAVATSDKAVAMVDKFFALPEAERLKVKADKNNRGYRDVWDGVHSNGKPNARDSFDLGFPVTEDDPEVLAGTPLYAPNQWPDMPGFREAIEAYYKETFRLGMKIMEGFALYLGKPEDFFTRHFTKPVADMVINHYLGAAGLHISDQASGPHTDHGIVTILWQDSLGGLEVMGKDGKWISATPLRGSFEALDQRPLQGDGAPRRASAGPAALFHAAVLQSEFPDYRRSARSRHRRRRCALSADPVRRVSASALQGDPQAVGRRAQQGDRRQCHRGGGGVAGTQSCGMRSRSGTALITSVSAASSRRGADQVAPTASRRAIGAGTRARPKWSRSMVP